MQAVFALTQPAYGKHSVDSSGVGNHGTLTNMESADWVFDSDLGRWVLNHEVITERP